MPRSSPSSNVDNISYRLLGTLSTKYKKQGNTKTMEKNPQTKADRVLANISREPLNTKLISDDCSFTIFWAFCQIEAWRSISQIVNCSVFGTWLRPSFVEGELMEFYFCSTIKQKACAETGLHCAACRGCLFPPTSQCSSFDFELSQNLG